MLSEKLQALVSHPDVDQVTICGGWLKDETGDPGSSDNPCGYLVVVGGFHWDPSKKESDYWGLTIEDALDAAHARLAHLAGGEQQEGKR